MAGLPLPDVLRAGRQSAGLSRAAAADEFGVTVATVGHWERGDRIPAIGHLEALARRYELDLGTLTSLASDMQRQRQAA